MSSGTLIEIESNSALSFPSALPIVHIAKLSCDTLSFQVFYKEYMLKNIPIIITNISKNWECHENWVTDDKLNTDFLRNRLSNRKVPIANCTKQFYNSHEKFELELHSFLTYWDDLLPAEDLYYLKDWHLRKEEPDYEFYEVPQYFASDWLNEYLVDQNRDDYMFVYLGLKGTWTPFHADVFSSYSWSTNILGKKKWILLPPQQETKLFDKFNNLPFNVTKEILDSKCVQYYEIIQNAGEAIFVPSQWHHQVWNVEHTLSINHNWFNGCNIEIIYGSLAKSYENVLKEIDDCKAMENFFEHSQLMLKSYYGMNFLEFYQILQHIGEKRLKRLTTGDNFVVFDKFHFGNNMIEYDLRQIKKVLQLMIARDGLLEQLGIKDTTVEMINKIQALINR